MGYKLGKGLLSTKRPVLVMRYHSSLLCLASIQISSLDLVGMRFDSFAFIGLHVLEAQVWRLNAPS